MGLGSTDSSSGCPAKKIRSILSPSSSSRCSASASHYPLQWIRWVWGEGKRFSLEQTHKKEWIPNTGEFLQHLAAGQCQHLGMRARDSLGSSTGHLETPTPTIKSLYCGIQTLAKGWLQLPAKGSAHGHLLKEHPNQKSRKIPPSKAWLGQNQQPASHVGSPEVTSMWSGLVDSRNLIPKPHPCS